MAANTFQAGGVDNNWGTTGNWSTGSVPTAADGNVATFDGTSPNCTVNTSARVCNAINFTGYTNTITMTNQITVSGNITLAAAMGISGTGAMLVNAASTMTSNGRTWPNAFTFSGAATYTLADNWDIDGVMTVSANSTINGNQISVGGLLTCNINITVQGTTNLIVDSISTTLTTSGSGAIKNNLTINSAGTVVTSAAFNYNTGTFTYTAGTVSTIGSTMTCAASTTFAASGITWTSVSFTTASTVITLNEEFNVAGLMGLGGAAANVTVNGSAVNSRGGLRYLGTSGTISGTSTFNVLATQTVDGPSTTTGRVSNLMTFNAPGGTITVDDTFNMQLDNLLYTAGTVITDAGTWSTRSAANILGGSVIH